MGDPVEQQRFGTRLLGRVRSVCSRRVEMPWGDVKDTSLFFAFPAPPNNTGTGIGSPNRSPAMPSPSLPAGLRAARAHNAAARPDSEMLTTLRAALPQFFDAAGVFKRDKFDAALAANNIAEARDGYRLSFVGKDYARLQSSRASETLLVPDIAHNSRPENANSGNVFITGDNLEALLHLKRAYSGLGNRVKVIYIDPPYNTGKEFTYSDRFDFSDEKLQTMLGYSERDVERLKCIQGKSSHSAWLTFMYPRLKLAKELLRDDGVIFVSIDDNEQANLKLLMDEIFGETNFVAQLIWERAYAPKNDARFVSNSHDYVLMFAKNIEAFSIGRLERTEEANARYENPDNDPRGVWKPSDMSVKTYNVASDYKITTPSGRVVEPPTGRCWSLSEKAFSERLADNRIWFGADGNSVPCIKRFLTELKFDGMAPTSIMSYKEVGHSQEGAKEVTTLLGSGAFDGPKPVRLIRRLLTLANTDKNSLVLDFFAGSGTTAHAVMQMNAEDGGNRKYICVQIDEPTPENSEARKSGYKTIDAISRERIKRAAAKIREENPLAAQTANLGFRHYKLALPPANILEKIDIFTPDQSIDDDNITPFANAELNATGLDVLLTTWVLDDGFPFDTPVQKITFGEDKNEYTAHLVSGKLYLISRNWGAAQTRDLLNRIGTNELDIKHIVIYAFSFSLESLRELENNIKNNLDGDHQVSIERRY
ncbi:MAG: site-specific DNA-methyltransferase [Opitutaceae bacterium]|jgi:adenine-specific DNA-methyltransferase|nr:site-specific DNA-methyltransferase [Opitutaceae bacterium]